MVRKPRRWRSEGIWRRTWYLIVSLMGKRSLLPVDLSSERREGSERGGEASERIRAVEKWLTIRSVTTEVFEHFCSSARELEVPASRRPARERGRGLLSYDLVFFVSTRVKSNCLITASQLCSSYVGQPRLASNEQQACTTVQLGRAR
jgi:hypothetical protein